LLLKTFLIQTTYTLSTCICLNAYITTTTLSRIAPAPLLIAADDLSLHVAESAHVAASHAAYTAQRQAERVSAITDILANAVEAAVQTAAASAQRCAHRQAGRAAAFADDRAAAANQALNSLAGVLPGYVPPPAAADGFGSSSSSRARGSGTGAPEFDPWANVQPRNAPPPDAARPGGSNSAVRAAANAQNAAQCTTPAAAAAAALPVLRTQLQSSQAALSATEAALADVQVQLVVKQLTADIFRAVERKAAQEEMQQLQQELQACRWGLKPRPCWFVCGANLSRLLLPLSDALLQRAALCPLLACRLRRSLQLCIVCALLLLYVAQ
jgi:hypothetical protein